MIDRTTFLKKLAVIPFLGTILPKTEFVPQEAETVVTLDIRYKGQNYALGFRLRDNHTDYYFEFIRRLRNLHDAAKAEQLLRSADKNEDA